MKNYIVFVTTLVFLIVILTLTRVDGKISVILTPENETVFTVHEQPLLPKVNSGAEGYLVNSNPEDACTQVNPPPIAERDAVNKVGNNSVNGTNGNSSQWILIATWNNLNDSCNLLVKAKNAQKAGYSAIIIQNVLSNDSIGAISIYDWYQVNIYPCLVGSFDGKLLRENFISNEYLLRFEDDGVNTWFAYAVAGILVFLGLLLVAGLGYVVTQMLLLVLLWLGQIITTTIQQRRRNRRRRLPPSLLKRLPTQLWTDDIPQDTCSVCLENFQEGERVRVLPCSHIFHMVCIDPWLLNQRRKCPNCQGKITFPDERPSESDSSTDDEQAPLLRQSSSSSSSQTNQGAVSENEVEHERQQLQERLHAIQRILQEVAVLALVESDNDHSNRTGSARHNSEFQSESQEPPSETALQLQRQHPNLFTESSTTPSNRGRNSLSRKVQHLVTDNALPQISEVDHEQDSLSSSLSGHGLGGYSCPEAEIDERMGISAQSSSHHPSTTNCTSNNKCQDSPEASTSVDNSGNNQDSSYTDVRVFVSQSTPMGGSSTDKNQASNQKDMI